MSRSGHHQAKFCSNVVLQLNDVTSWTAAVLQRRLAVVIENNTRHLPLRHEPVHLLSRSLLVPAELVLDVLVPQSLQVYGQEPVQDQDSLVQGANSGHVGRCHAGQLINNS